MNQVRWIADQKSWDHLSEQLAGEPELAVDTESNSLYAYRERICLVQLATSDEAYLIDPLAVKDLSSLGRLLADPHILKVLHGSNYDLRSLDREYGYRVKSLLDTGVAARFLGTARPNLAAVLETFLGVGIPKTKRLQKSDWGLRPLGSLAMQYAAADVCYLTRLAAELRRRLADLKRLEWLGEECALLEQIRYSPPESREDAFPRTKGSAQLDPGTLAVLKELVAFREAEAQRLDWPPFKVARNDALLFLAQRPNTPLEKVPGLPRWLVERSGERIQAAIQQGLRSPGLHRPRTTRWENPWTPESQARLQRLKRWRADRGAMLGLDPALLWPTSSLERLALQPESWREKLEISPSPPSLKGGVEDLPSDESDAGEPGVRQWQRREFAEELKRVLDERLG